MMVISKVNKIVHLAIKLIVFSLVTIVLYRGINDFFSSSDDLSQLWYTTDAIGLLTIVFVLMLINWLLEAIKWKALVSSVVDISLGKSFLAVITGVTLGLITPNKLGSFLGQVVYLPDNVRRRASWSTLYGNFAQMLVTFTFGTMALGVSLSNNLLGYKYEILLQVSFVVSVLMNFLIVILFFHSVKFWNKLKFIEKINPKWSQLINHQSLNFSEKGAVLLISAGRYLVFVSQYYLLLLFFDIQLSVVEGFVIIALTFFILNFIPSPFLGKLGVRESVALFVIGPYCNCELQAVVASFMLWIINLAIPGMVGALLLFKLNLKRERSA